MPSNTGSITATPTFNTVTQNIGKVDGDRGLRLNGREIYANASKKSRFAGAINDLFAKITRQKTRHQDATTLLRQSFAKSYGNAAADAAFKKLRIGDKVTGKQLEGLKHMARTADKLGLDASVENKRNAFLTSQIKLPNFRANRSILFDPNSNHRALRNSLTEYANRFVTDKANPGGDAKKWAKLQEHAAKLDTMSFSQLGKFEQEVKSFARSVTKGMKADARLITKGARPAKETYDSVSRKIGSDHADTLMKEVGSDKNGTLTARQSHKVSQFMKALDGQCDKDLCIENMAYLNSSAEMQMLDPANADDRERMSELHDQLQELFFDKDSKTEINVESKLRKSVKSFEASPNMSEQDARNLKALYEKVDHSIENVVRTEPFTRLMNKSDSMMDAAHKWQMNTKEVKNIQAEIQKVDQILEQLGKTGLGPGSTTRAMPKKAGGGTVFSKQALNELDKVGFAKPKDPKAAKLDGKKRPPVNYDAAQNQHFQNAMNDKVRKVVSDLKHTEVGNDSPPPTYSQAEKEMNRATYNINGAGNGFSSINETSNTAGKFSDLCDSAGIPAEHVSVMSAAINQDLFNTRNMEVWKDPDSGPLKADFHKQADLKSELSYNVETSLTALTPGFYEFTATQKIRPNAMTDLSVDGGAAKPLDSSQSFCEVTIKGVINCNIPENPDDPSYNPVTISNTTINYQAKATGDKDLI
ncbi:MAG: hypothetical protein AAGG47_01580 [Pseudomonadota bacterium]